MVLAVVVQANVVKVPGAHMPHVAAVVEPARQKVEPAVHGTGEVVVGEAQKLPAGQVAQMTLAVKLQAEVTYWPTVHAPHVVHGPTALAVVE